ncbi:synaptotagmin-C [Nilaparvata lugens]|uniref:synaptotagmin-C n=1 Tax=Nilaparvata lugens TaxID=108931 RepID=UPI00193DD511|nr:synaptotagmin-C [Nilaparvata lugens]
MVTSAVLGAATGTGLALVVAMTIVVYRYYAARRYGKDWEYCDSWATPVSHYKHKPRPRPATHATGYSVSPHTSHTMTHYKMLGYPPVRTRFMANSCQIVSSSIELRKKIEEMSKPQSPAGIWATHNRIETWAKMAKLRATASVSGATAVFNVSQEQRNVQPPSSSPPAASHPNQHMPQPPSTAPTGAAPAPAHHDPHAHLTHQSRSYPLPTSPRTLSMSSQSSLDSAVSKQSSHRGSLSPQIRMLGSQSQCEPPRSPSPGPCLVGGHNLERTPSPSQSSLTSAGSGSDRSGVRLHALSPLLLPPRGSTPACGEAPPSSPLGALQPDLYQPRDVPLFLKSANRSGPSLGRLHLRLDYDFDRSDLHVHLIEAHELAGSGEGGFNDPYVRLTMSPEVDNRKRQTNIHRNDPNPFFDQHFKFPVSHEDLHDKTLILQVMIILQPPEETQEILLSLSYLPSAERLTVVLLKARNLFLPQNKEVIDPYVKVYLVIGGKRVKKKKTAARKSCTNPVWNEALVFNVPSHSIAHSCIEVCLMDQADMVSNKGLLGSCVIGPHEEGPPQDHWHDMTQSPRKAVAMWHSLR